MADNNDFSKTRLSPVAPPADADIAAQNGAHVDPATTIFVVDASNAVSESTNGKLSSPVELSLIHI